MKRRLEISVVVCTRNRVEYLKKCIASLIKQSYLPKEIIIVDDSSEENLNLYEFLKNEIYNFILNFKISSLRKMNLILLKNKRNFGLAYSRNLGIKVASGDVVAFQDDDSFAHQDWIKNLAKNYKDEKVIGVGGPFIELGRKNLKTVTKSIKRLIYISPKKGRFIINYRIKKLKDAKFLPKMTVPFLLGGNMSFRREVLLSINGVDIRFSGNGYHEETDMGLRASKLGKLLFEPSAITYHDTAMKGGNREIIKFDLNKFLYYMFRNTVILFFKNFDLRKASMYIWKMSISQIKMLMKGQTGLTRDFLKIKNRFISVFYSIMGFLAGLYCFFITRNKETNFIFSQPESIEMYKIAILGSSIKIIELENRTHLLKKILGLG